MLKTAGYIRRNLLLLAILVMAAVARYWGIGFGLPHLDARPDETTVMNVAVTFFTGDLNPHFFNYPTLYMYCLSCLYLGYYSWGALSGKYLSMSDLAAQYTIDPAHFFLLNRSLSALAGTATVLVVYMVATRVAGRRTALISSLFLALSHLHVRDSHFGVTDVAATFLIMCSTLFILRSHGDKSPRSYLLAGAFAGLAASTKYAGLLLIVPMVIVHIFNGMDLQVKPIGSFLDRRILLFFGALALAFLLGSPFILLDFPRFASDFAAEARHLSSGHRVILGRGWWYHLRFSLLFGLGWSLLLSSLAGTLVLMRKDLRKALVFCSFPLAYYGVVGSGYTVFLRYAIPLVPFLCTTGAVCAVAASDALHRLLRLPKTVASVLVASLTALPSANSVVHSDRLLATTDNRLLAVEWARQNIPAGTSVFLTGPIWREYRPNPALELLEARYGLPALDASSARTGDFRSREGGPAKYDRWSYDAESGRFESNGEIKEGLPLFIFTRESPLLARHGTPQAIAQLLARSYQLKRSFHALDMSREHFWFDQQDGFFIPFAGFAGVERPGPNIHIYERTGGGLE